MLRIAFAAAVVLSAASVLAGQQSGNANRDYTINGNGGGQPSLVTHQLLAPGPFDNVYGTLDPNAPLVWMSATQSMINWLPGFSQNSVDIGPGGLSFLLNGADPLDPLALFAVTDASGSWQAGLTVGQAGGLTRFFALAHLSPQSADGFYISQTHQVNFVMDGNLAPTAGTSCNPAAVQQTHLDDGSVQTPLANWSVTYYGVTYTEVFVNSNGNLTFSQGDTDFTESVSELLNNAPRVAMYWDDLNPSNFGGGTITFYEDPALLFFEVCFTNVPEFPGAGSNTFRVRFDDGAGQIQFDYDAGMTALDGIVGLSPGNGVDPVGNQINLSIANHVIAPGSAAFEVFDMSNPNDLPGFQVLWLLDGAPNGNNPILQL